MSERMNAFNLIVLFTLSVLHKSLDLKMWQRMPLIWLHAQRLCESFVCLNNKAPESVCSHCRILVESCSCLWMFCFAYVWLLRGGRKYSSQLKPDYLLGGRTFQGKLLLQCDAEHNTNVPFRENVWLWVVICLSAAAEFANEKQGWLTGYSQEKKK